MSATQDKEQTCFRLAARGAELNGLCVAFPQPVSRIEAPRRQENSTVVGPGVACNQDVGTRTTTVSAPPSGCRNDRHSRAPGSCGGGPCMPASASFLPSECGRRSGEFCSDPSGSIPMMRGAYVLWARDVRPNHLVTLGTSHRSDHALAWHSRLDAEPEGSCCKQNQVSEPNCLARCSWDPLLSQRSTRRRMRASCTCAQGRSSREVGWGSE